MRILIIEDEIRLARNIKKGLETLPSFVADMVHDGEDGLHLAITQNYDLIILDLMLPGLDGLALLRRLREAGRETPVLILTAKTSRDDVIRGLNYGSDDYLAKPFDMGELLARIKALIRRSHGRPNPCLQVGELKIDTHAHRVHWCAHELTLPPLEYRMLEYMAYQSGRPVSKTELLEHLYDYNWEKFSNVIEVYISSLRRKLEAVGAPQLIHTMRGHGYQLSAAAQECKLL